MPDRPCRYCEGPTNVTDAGAFETQHVASDCPNLTRLFPVEEADVTYGGEFHGMRCGDCKAELRIGDTYMRGPAPLDHPFEFLRDVPNVFGIYCVGCAALQAVS